MLNLYISHAPADHKYVEQFMDWIRPMQEKYYLRIWYDHPEPDPIVPYPWNVIFFWYEPKRRKRLYNRNMPDELDKAHIYLFFTSQKALGTDWIDQIEIPAAVSRYQQQGHPLVRIFPVLIATSQWKLASRLAGFKALGPVGKPLSQVQPSEDGWYTFMEELRVIIEELRSNHLTQHQQLALPVDAFYTPPVPWHDTPEQVLPLSRWAGWIVLIGLIWACTSWLMSQFKPAHPQYWPKKEIPREPLPNAAAPGREVPVSPRDSIKTPSGGVIREPK